MIGKTTLKDFLAKIEDQYGKADRIWVMDRGIPTEETLEQMRRSVPPVSYLVGTPKGKLTTLEQSLLKRDWQPVRIDVRIDEIVLRALEKTPERRYQTIAEMRTELETVAADQAIPAPAPSPRSRLSGLILPLLVFGAGYLVFAGYLWQTHAQFPERVASHFNADGHPDGSMSRTSYFVVFAALPLVMAALFGFFTWLPRLQPRLVNLPNRSYWLAPERIVQTCDFLLSRLLWLAVLLMVLFAALHAMILDANRSPAPHLSSGGTLWLVIGFFACFIVWLVAVLSHFTAPASAPASIKPPPSTAGGTQVPHAVLGPERVALGYLALICGGMSALSRCSTARTSPGGRFRRATMATGKSWTA